MSEPRIKVSQCYEAGFEWKCTAATHHQCDGPIREWVRGRTIAAAADAGRAHLAEHHAQPMTPIVQTIVSGTRCTCGDLPRNTYPYFSPCPVHSYLINSVTTTNAPAQGYCRLHGVHRSVCGCQVASVDPEALGGRENGSCVIHADPDLLAKVDNAPEKPSEALQRLFDTTRSDT